MIILSYDDDDYYEAKSKHLYRNIVFYFHVPNVELAAFMAHYDGNQYMSKF